MVACALPSARERERMNLTFVIGGFIFVIVIGVLVVWIATTTNADVVAHPKKVESIGDVFTIAFERTLALAAATQRTMTTTTQQQSSTKSFASATFWSSNQQLQYAPKTRRRKNRTIAPVVVVDKSNEFANSSYSCSDMKHIEKMDDVPFARGASKSAWRVVDQRNGLRFVLKLANDATPDQQAELNAKFVEAITTELALWRKLNAIDSTIVPFIGFCLPTDIVVGGDDGGGGSPTTPFVAAAGPLAPWKFISYEEIAAVGCCERIALAVSLARMLLAFELIHAVHCDWKPDQVVIDYLTEPLTVKLVDLKSLTVMKRLRDGSFFPIGAATTCSSDSDCVQFCFKWQWEQRVEDAHYVCDQSTKTCRGIDSSSMIVATKRLFFDSLFRNSSVCAAAAMNVDGDDGDVSLRRRIDVLMMAMTQRERRVDAAQLLNDLVAIQNSFRLLTCSNNAGAVREAFERAMEQRLATSNQRCKKKFC